ncbi:hypothetical protein M0R45_025314 [Rubus argutus]|uniref:Uncharacterized protein n=1 Tax=Rubus argutus TaxID=59490 RepID=A0AAW1WWX7_RUBAR
MTTMNTIFFGTFISIIASLSLLLLSTPVAASPISASFPHARSSFRPYFLLRLAASFPGDPNSPIYLRRLALRVTFQQQKQEAMRLVTPTRSPEIQDVGGAAPPPVVPTDPREF